MLSAATDRFRPDLPFLARLEALAGFGFQRFEVALRGVGEPPELAGRILRERRWAIGVVDTLAATELPGLADPIDERRELAVARTAAAARWALAHGCRRIVVDPGPIALPDARRGERIAWEHRARHGTDDPDATLAGLVAARAGAIDEQIDRLCRSLHALDRALPDALWCLPTPAGPADLPAPTEFEWILDDLGPKRVAYWHRTAAAERARRLGGPPPAEWLEAFGARTAGAHLTDLSGEDWDLLPGIGQIDFGELDRALPGEAERVVPIPPTGDPIALMAALDYLASNRFRIE